MLRLPGSISDIRVFDRTDLHLIMLIILMMMVVSMRRRRITIIRIIVTIMIIIVLFMAVISVMIGLYNDKDNYYDINYDI